VDFGQWCLRSRDLCTRAFRGPWQELIDLVFNRHLLTVDRIPIGQAESLPWLWGRDTDGQYVRDRASAGAQHRRDQLTLNVDMAYVDTGVCGGNSSSPAARRELTGVLLLYCGDC
jgi:hypothetical protein